jgi:metal transporter CNNM
MLIPVFNLAREMVPLLKKPVDDSNNGEEGLPPGSPEFWWKLGISAGFVLLGGLFAG